MTVDMKQAIRKVKWTTEHTLDKEQLKQLIEAKFKRAKEEMERRKELPIAPEELYV